MEEPTIKSELGRIEEESRTCSFNVVVGGRSLLLRSSLEELRARVRGIALSCRVLLCVGTLKTGLGGSLSISRVALYHRSLSALHRGIEFMLCRLGLSAWLRSHLGTGQAGFGKVLTCLHRRYVRNYILSRVSCLKKQETNNESSNKALQGVFFILLSPGFRALVCKAPGQLPVPCPARMAPAPSCSHTRQRARHRAQHRA